MKNSNDIPNEILYNIFQNLRNKDLVQCSLTCRSWAFVSQRVLFRHLYPISDISFTILEVALSAYQPNLSFTKYKESPANFVKQVYCYPFKTYFDASKLDRMFPFLEHIKLGINRQSIHEKICQTIKNGGFSKLKSIPYCYLNKEHADFLLTHGTHIEELYITDKPLDLAAYRLFDNLHLFTNLRLIELHNGTKKTIVLENWLSKIPPTLESIIFRIAHHSTISLSTSLLDLDNIQPLKTVREVQIINISASFFTGEETYLYFMKKFPNLEKLHLSFGYENPPYTLNYINPSDTTLIQFLKYIFKIKISSVSQIPYKNGYPANVLQSYFQYALTQTSYRNVKLHLTISFTTVDPLQWEKYRYPPLQTTNFIVDNDYGDYWKLCKTIVSYNVMSGSASKPHLELLQNVGSSVEILTLTQMQDTEKEPLLAWIFRYFTKLKNLRICDNPAFNFCEETLSPVENVASSTIDNLLFNISIVDSLVFPEISKRCPNLKLLEISNCEITNRLDQYNHSFPRIVVIKMFDTTIRNFRFHPIVSHEKLRQYDRAFVRLATINKKARYSKILLRGKKDEQSDNLFDEDYTEDDFKQCLDDRNCIVYNIYCKSVAQMTVIDRSFPRRKRV